MDERSPAVTRRSLHGVADGHGPADRPEPYAYVGPWTPRTGAFWNAPFGATRTLAELSDVLEFFTAGRSLLDN